MPGRFFERSQRPGLADAVGGGRVRIDAIGRWLHDLAYLDLLDAGLEAEGIWIVRRTSIRIAAFPRFGEEVTMRTACTGIGRFSAERTTHIAGATASIEAVALWVWLDAATMRPQRFPERFIEVYRESAGGRDAKVRLRHPDPPERAPRDSWRFRASDCDVAGHVNNASYLAVIEEELAGREPGSLELEAEYRDAAQPGEAFVIADGEMRWIVGELGEAYASIRIGSR